MFSHVAVSCNMVQYSTVHKSVLLLRFLLVIKHPIPASMNGAPPLLIAASWPLEAGTGILDQTSCVQNSCLVNLQKIIYLIKVRCLEFFCLLFDAESYIYFRSCRIYPSVG
ncbi:hypothetical protein S83_069490 [Arachis hypogaea]